MAGAPRWRQALRLARVLFALGWGLLFALALPALSAAARDRQVRRWSRAMLAALDVRLRVVGGTPPAGCLLVANHVSWLDILCVNALQPVRFVAKRDIRGWPLIGWLAQRAGTLFVDNSRARDALRVAETLERAVRAGERVGFFPEGRVMPGGEPGAFHPFLFEAAARLPIPVQPVALAYLGENGRRSAAASYFDIPLGTSVRRVLACRALEARITVCAPLPGGTAHRRELADAARRDIAAALPG